MKKSVLILLSIILCVSIAGCGGNKTANADNTTPVSQNNDVTESEDKNDEADSSEQKSDDKDVSSEQKPEIQSTEESTAEETENDTSDRTKESKNGFDEATNKDILFKGCSIVIPEYFGENKSKNDNALTYYAETGWGVTMLSVTTNNYNKSEEDYKKEEDSIVMQLLTGISNGGMSVDLDKSNFKNRHFRGSMDHDGRTIGLEFEIRPLYLDDMVMVLTLTQSDESEYDYFSDFEKIANSVKRLEEESGSNDSEDNDGGDMDPDFKKTMDDYEEFFDEYVEFMKKYQKNPSDLTLLSEMTGMLQKETEMMDNFNNIDQDELSPDELSYYLEVQSRILKKLSEVY